MCLTLAGCQAGGSGTARTSPLRTATAPAETSGGPTAVTPASNSVAVYVSSQAGERLASKPELTFAPGAAADGTVFTVDDSATFQQIDGFGATFNEAGIVTLNTLPDEQDQQAVLAALFDRTRGAGLSLMKSPLSATDFMSQTQDWYTYDDAPGDTALRHFSIARDLQANGLITYIKRARSAGGAFRLQSTMDYPPDWMLKDVNTDQDVDPRYYATLADYYTRYLREYEANGVHIDELSLFNEPGYYTKITYPEIRTLIRDFVGPAFKRDGVSTGLQVSEAQRRSDAAEAYPVVLDDATARSYVSSLAYHGYDYSNWDRVAQLHARYPTLHLWMTEICCVLSQAEQMKFSSGDFWVHQLMGDLDAGASGWIWWNMILDETGGPWLVSPIHVDPDGNAQNSVVVVDRTTHAVTYTGLYWYLAHFSRFVRPGAVRIGTSRSGAPDQFLAMSFRNADGPLVTELVNSGRSDVSVGVDWRGMSVSAHLPAVSITTLVWQR